jgi:hypothetical protein
MLGAISLVVRMTANIEPHETRAVLISMLFFVLLFGFVAAGGTAGGIVAPLFVTAFAERLDNDTNTAADCTECLP